MPEGSSKHYKSIPTKTLFYIAWRNLTSKKLRTALTITGVIIGVGAIFFLLSFGLGLRLIVTNEVLGNQSVQSIDVTSPNSRVLKLDQQTVEKINGLPHVRQLSSSFSFPGSIQLSGSELDAIVYGIDTPYQTMTTLNLTKGRLLNKEDVKVAVINRASLKSMGITDDSKVLDKELRIRVPLQRSGAIAKQLSDNYKIVGIIDSGSGSEVFIPRFQFEAAGVPEYSQVKILTDDTKNVDSLRSQVESLGFETNSPLDTIDQINQIFRFFNVILVGFGAVGMIVAVLGMFNTLTISLLERTKEIGLMIALGARHRDMRRLFVFEAALLSVLGAVLGVILAVVVGWVINIVMNSFARRRGVTETFSLFATPLWLAAATVLLMLIVGLVVVYFPARRAEKINPIDALRRE